MTKPSEPAIVVGSGFGGLAAAVRTRAMGYPTMLLEARDQLGGRASVLADKGFTFDMGPTVITAPYLIEELFSLVGRDWRDYLEMMPVDPYYRIDFHDGTKFDYVGDEERLLANIREVNPRDVDNYQRMLKKMKEIFDIGYMNLADVPFDKVSDMLKVIPDLVRLQSYKSVYALVSSYIEDERLRQVFTFQPLLVGGNPFKVTSIYCLIHWLERKWGVHYIKGGTGALVKALHRLLEDIGVEVRTSAPVDHIDVGSEGQVNGVRLEGGEHIPCSLVVANADPRFVYGKMIDAKHRQKHSDASVRRKKGSMSLFVAYFGTKKPYPDLAHHTIVLGPRYKGLLTDIFDKKTLADDFSLYLHAPTRSDASMAPAGHECFYVLSPVPNNRSGLNWSEIGDAYLDRIYGELEKRGLPGLRDELVTSHFITPDHFENELRSVDGAAFGLEPLLTQSAWFRYHNRSEDVRGLYFVGASVHPGAGLPGVLSTAKATEKLMPVLPDGDRLAIPGPGAGRKVAV